MSNNEKFKGFRPRPNLTGYTALPNEFFDEVLPTINNMSELKILLAVFRKTYGWVKAIDQETGQPIYKLEDEISYSQFEKMTGLSSTSVATGLSRAQQNGYLEKVQQGNYSGTTSAYRVVTTDEEPKPKSKTVKRETTPNKPVQTNTPPIVRLDIGTDNTPDPRKINGTSLYDVTKGMVNGKPAPPKSAKESIIDDIFSSPAQEEPEPKEKKKTPHQEFISNWLRCYYSKLNIKYGNLSGKEHGHIKSMLKEYDLPMVLTAMEFYFNNFADLEGVPNDAPTITVFYSWRKKLIPLSQGVVKPMAKKPRNSREYEETKWQEGDDFFDN